MEKSNVVRLEYSKNKVEAITSKETFNARYIILADGVTSPLAKNMGWPDNRKLIPAMETEVKIKSRTDLYEKVRFDFGFISGGYAWVFPKTETLSIGMLGGNGVTLRRELKRYLRFLGLETQTNQNVLRGYPIPMEYPVLDFFSIPYLSKTFQKAWATSSAVLPGFVWSIPACNASMVLFIVSIFNWSGFPRRTVRAIGAWYLL